MQKEWFIQIEGKQEGPYSFEDLKRDRRITPETLVWKEGFLQWVPIGEVAELKDIFKDEIDPNPSDDEEEAKTLIKKKLPENDVLTLQYDPSHWIVWMLIILLILLYTIFRSFER